MNVTIFLIFFIVMLVLVICTYNTIDARGTVEFFTDINSPCSVQNYMNDQIVILNDLVAKRNINLLDAIQKSISRSLEFGNNVVEVYIFKKRDDRQHNLGPILPVNYKLGFDL